ncbi:MAG: hypothetical protein IT308_02235 [Anaerolineaceae bacterium]|nr:hypothetical protein [Anaerolineaceae bacterium]
MTLLSRPLYHHNSPPKPAPEHDYADTVRRECGRLIHAAVINKRFCAMLLANPVKSIETGYHGEKFSFTREEKARIRHIQAQSLEDFAAQLMQVVEKPVVSEFAYARQK